MQELATLKQVGIYRPYQLTIDGKGIFTFITITAIFMNLIKDG